MRVLAPPPQCRPLDTTRTRKRGNTSSRIARNRSQSPGPSESGGLRANATVRQLAGKRAMSLALGGFHWHGEREAHVRMPHQIAAAATEVHADSRVRAHCLQDRSDSTLQIAARITN